LNRSRIVAATRDKQCQYRTISQTAEATHYLTTAPILLLVLKYRSCRWL